MNGETLFDKELIQRVCALCVNESDFDKDLEEIKYDTDSPFRKYYSFETLKGAIEKFISGEWSDRKLAHWACLYAWILTGGTDYEKVTDNLNSFERFFRDFVVWDLDGLSFFIEEDFKGETLNMREWIRLFGDYDHIWKTRYEWRVFYAMVGPNAKENEDQFAILLNKKRKEYMIMYSDHIQNGYRDKFFKFIKERELIRLVEELVEEGYTRLGHSEERYYLEIEDL